MSVEPSQQTIMTGAVGRRRLHNFWTVVGGVLVASAITLGVSLGTESYAVARVAGVILAFSICAVLAGTCATGPGNCYDVSRPTCFVATHSALEVETPSKWCLGSTDRCIGASEVAGVHVIRRTEQYRHLAGNSGGVIVTGVGEVPVANQGLVRLPGDCAWLGMCLGCTESADCAYLAVEVEADDGDRDRDRAREAGVGSGYGSNSGANGGPRPGGIRGELVPLSRRVWSRGQLRELFALCDELRQFWSLA